MKVNPVVFFVSAGVILLFVILGALFNQRLEATFGALQTVVVDNFGWFYILSVAGFLLFVIWLYFSPYGRIKLGADDDEPEYSRTTWFAMLFSAGMGIGLLFFSVAEPILHFARPPHAEPQSIEAARQALDITLFHWGVHAWAIYIIMGLSLSYFAYRHNLPLSIRSSLYPLLGKRIFGIAGHLVEILAVFGTLFGVATSLGLGAQQINAGFSHLGLMGLSQSNQLWLIGGITLVATASVVSGLDVGIRRLSEISLAVGVLLLLLVFTLGPTQFLLSSLVQAIGRYLHHLPEMTFRTNAYTGTEWQKTWTMFYWGWWISWSPFVGMFIARVSRGRTIREFILGALLAPTVLTLVWMGVFGNSAIYLSLQGDSSIVQAVTESIPTGLFVLLEKLPGAKITTLLATITIGTYFVTSSDSASLVIDILTSNGDPNPPVGQRVFWALTEGAVAAVLLVTGGLIALQTAALTTALPLCAVMLLICWSLAKGLRRERRGELPPGLHASPRPLSGTEPNAAALGAQSASGGETAMKESWRSRLGKIVAARQQQESQVDLDQARAGLARFIEVEVVPAFETLKEELVRHGRQAVIDRQKHHATLTVLRDDDEEFSYAVRGHAYHRMRFAFPRLTDRDAPEIYRAEVVLPGGREEEHPISRWSQKGIIEDFLQEYEKWLGWRG